MKIELISDLHIDFYSAAWKKFVPGDPEAILLCAGDIGELIHFEPVQALRWLCKRYKEVYYITGNHDYYRSNFFTIDSLLIQLENEIENLTILRTGRICQFGEYKLVGDTGWIPYDSDLQLHKINDSFMIKGLTPEIHIKHKAWRDFLWETVDNKTIIMSHHLPSKQCIAPQFINEPTNKWFMGSIEDIIQDKKPYIVLFGHTHTIMDFQLYDTRLICHPLGYPRENPDFKGPLKLDI